MSDEPRPATDEANQPPEANSSVLLADEAAETAVRESSLGVLLEHPTTQDLDPVRVRQAFRDSEVWVLGFPAGETTTRAEGIVGGSESDILHFTIDDEDGKEKTLLPAFTSRDTLREALLRNPEWHNLSVLGVNGGALLDNIDKEVDVVVNPWTRLEYQLPNPQR